MHVLDKEDIVSLVDDWIESFQLQKLITPICNEQGPDLFVARAIYQRKQNAFWDLMLLQLGVVNS